MGADPDTELTGGSRTGVFRRGRVVARDTGPWTPAVHSLLRHLERVGFTGAPRLVGSGLDADGRELLTFIEGGFTHPGPWSLDGAAAVAQLRAMTDAYGLSAAQRRGFVDRIIEFMVSETAWEADDAGVTPELTSHPMALWAMARRARAAA